jgi:hypothetical protein
MIVTVDDIIGMLIGVDLLSLSLVTLIYRWARHAVRNIRKELLSLLTEEGEERDLIVDSIAKGIWKRINASLNMNKIPRDPESLKQYFGNMSESDGANPENSELPLKEIAGAMGINDQGFLKYLPYIMKFMNKNQGGNSNNSNTSNDLW